LGALRVVLEFVVGFSLLGSVGAVAFAGLFLLFPERTRRILVPSLISYATGTLFGAAFLGLIPHAVEGSSVSAALAAVLAGMIMFFVLEKLVIWRHCHDEKCEVHGTAGVLILIGDAFHNFVDGVIISATFITSLFLGIATSLAVLAHEIPQEVGDFAILLESGYSKGRALTYNTLSSLSTLIGALLAYIFLTEVRAFTPYVMALSAASFIYIATADLVPVLHRHIGFATSLVQVILVLTGVGTILLFQIG
jgi:zinc and cadmium transporter